MTTFPFRFKLFRTLSLGLPLLTWLLVLPAEAISQPRDSADEQRTVEVHNPLDNNPLAPSETAHGELISDSSDQIKRARSSAAGFHKPPGSERLATVQLLYAQHHTNDKNAAPNSRKADVVYYNYSTNEAIQVVVDLNSNTVQDTQVKSGAAHQPFITRLEIQVALQRIFDDQHTGPLLRKAYLDITGTSLVDVISQLKDTQGGVFFHDPGTPLGAVTAACVHDRCVQLFIPINEASYIDMVNVVVDLSKMQVLWVDAGPTTHIH
jgi:hypothetical protein